MAAGEWHGEMGERGWIFFLIFEKQRSGWVSEWNEAMTEESVDLKSNNLWSMCARGYRKSLPCFCLFFPPTVQASTIPPTTTPFTKLSSPRRAFHLRTLVPTRETAHRWHGCKFVPRLFFFILSTRGRPGKPGDLSCKHTAVQQLP